MGIFLQLNTDYYDMQVVKLMKKRKVGEVIKFAMDMISVRTYRQLVKGFTDNI